MCVRCMMRLCYLFVNGFIVGESIMSWEAGKLNLLAYDRGKNSVCKCCCGVGVTQPRSRKQGNIGITS